MRTAPQQPRTLIGLIGSVSYKGYEVNDNLQIYNFFPWALGDAGGKNDARHGKIGQTVPRISHSNPIVRTGMKRKKGEAPMTRRQIMQRVKRKNTPQELAVRRLLYSLGYRYRVNVKGLPGSPDIAIRSKKKAIFVHGCFWHRHNCYLATTPKTSTDFWLPKFEKNVERDRRKELALRELGWKVVTVWQCELDNPTKLRRRLKSFMRKHSSNT